MSSPVIDNASIIALISAVAGGFATKLIDSIFGAKKRDSDILLAEKKHSQDADSTARLELRTEAQRHRDALHRSEADSEKTEERLRAIIKRIEDERDSWREKFFGEQSKEMANFVQVQADLVELESLRDQKKQLQRLNDELTARIRTLTGSAK